MSRRPRIRFDSSDYERSHMKAPRGRGSWAFHAYFFTACGQSGRTKDFILSPSMTLADAKKWAREQVPSLVAANVPSDLNVTAVTLAILS